MISINRLEEMTIEELQTELKNFEEQIKLQNNFIDSLLKATNNSEWLDKSMLDDEVGEVIEKIELDYVQLNQLKAELAISIQENKEGRKINAELKVENNELKKQNNQLDNGINEQFSKIVELEGRNNLLKAILTEIKAALQFYNYSTIGKDKGNGIFEFEVVNDNVLGGKLICCYDTNPAKKALQKIDEVTNEHNG